MRAISEGRWLLGAAAVLLLAACGEETLESEAAGNAPPTISGSPLTAIGVSATYVFQPAARDSDGDPLIFGIDGKPRWLSFDVATGRLSGTPSNLDIGMHRGIVIWVSDGANQALLPAFDLTVHDAVPNRAPTIGGTPSSSVAVGRSYDFTPSASDADGDDLVFSALGLPGWAVLDASTGRISGTPLVGHIGTSANIVLSVSDGQLSASLPTFSITVVPVGSNSAPSIVGTAPSAVPAGTAYAFTPQATDADGDTLSFSITNPPVWAAFAPDTGRLSGTPTASHVGSYPNIVISVSDGTESVALGAFSIEVTAVASNDPPTISGTPPTTAQEGVLYSFRPTATDRNGDTLVFSIVNQPSWATFSTSTGRLRGTPGPSHVRTYADIRISVNDGQDSVSLAPFSITVAPAPNRPPVISGTPSAAVLAGAAYEFQPTASDPDGDALTFVVDNLPSWAAFSATTGRLSGTPDEGDVGTYSNIVIRVRDQEAETALPPFSIAVEATAMGSATLSWTAPTQFEDGSMLNGALIGFRIYWGTSSGNYTQSVTLDNPGLTTYVVENLVPGTYYFASTAMSTGGLESTRSNEAVKTIP